MDSSISLVPAEELLRSRMGAEASSQLGRTSLLLDVKWVVEHARRSTVRRVMVETIPTTMHLDNIKEDTSKVEDFLLAFGLFTGGEP